MHPRPAFLLPRAQAPTPYTPPTFAKRLAEHAPTHRLNLAMRPTPIEPWDLRSAFPSIPADATIHIKRDDQTGGPTSGNKIRKLEFLLADALCKKATTIITAGGVQSNHARATVAAARRLGLKAHVFLRTKNPDRPEELGADGNVLFHKVLGVEMHLVRPVPYLTGLLPRMEALAERLRQEGEEPYLIGIGGSDRIGLWGYVECFKELVMDGVTDFTDVVVPIGSGGTASGLAIGNYLTEGLVKVHAVTVCDNSEYFYGHLDEMLKAVGLDGETCARDILNIIEAKGRGYAVSTDKELEFGMRVAMETGVLLDPVYTLKGVYGMVNELEKGPDGVFGRDAKILFVHTGGIFGLFDRRIEPFLDHSLAKTWVDQ